MNLRPMKVERWRIREENDPIPIRGGGSGSTINVAFQVLALSSSPVHTHQEELRKKKKNASTFVISNDFFFFFSLFIQYERGKKGIIY